jgi:MFS family permease
MTALALPWFVLETTGSGSRAAFVVAAETLALVLFGVPSGSLASRLGARRTMLACDLLRAPAVAAIPLLAHAGLLQLPALLVIAFVVGAISAPYSAAQEVVLPELMQANALFQSASRLTYLAGPALAGLLIGLLGAMTVLVIDAATYFVSFLILASFIPRMTRSPQAHELKGLLAGARFLWSNPFLRTLTLALAGSQMAFQGLTIALPILAFERYDENAKLAGLLLATWGGGALAGSVIAYRVVSRFEPLVLGAVAWFIYALPLWVLVFELPAAALFPPLVLAGIGNGLRNPPLAAIRVLWVPAPLRPKAITAGATLSMLGGAISLGGIGAALRMFGIAPVFASVAAVSTASAVTFALAAINLGARERPFA